MTYDYRRAVQGAVVLAVLAIAPALVAEAVTSQIADDPGPVILAFWTSAVALQPVGAVGLAYAAGGTASTLRQGLLEGLAAGVGGTALGASAVSALLFVVFRAEGDLPVIAGAFDAALPTILVVGAISGLVAAWAGAGFRVEDSGLDGSTDA